MRRTATLAATSVVALLPTLAAPAQALSCVGPDDVIAEAEQVFTGRIVDASGGRLLIAVDEVWRGAPVEERVWMDVDLPGWSEWTEGDDQVADGYSSPDRWAFAPYAASVGPCTAWRLDREIVRRMAPDRAATPVPDDSLGNAAEAEPPITDEVGLLTAAGVGVGGGAAAATLALLLLRRRSPRRRSRRPPG